jgi:hypothetical protein
LSLDRHDGHIAKDQQYKIGFLRPKKDKIFGSGINGDSSGSAPQFSLTITTSGRIAGGSAFISLLKSRLANKLSANSLMMCCSDACTMLQNWKYLVVYP